MSQNFRIAVLGFSDFERRTLASYFRLAINRNPRYEQVSTISDCDFIVADTDHAPSLQLVLATERVAEAVFIGQVAPSGAVASMRRPIDPLHVLRELDALVATGCLGQSVVGDGVPGSRHAPGPAAAPGQGVGLLQRHVAEAGASARPPPSAPPPRALLVDDSEIALRFLESRLLPWGLVIDRAGSSGKAIELLSRQDYDFVFLDIELGESSELDGLALCQHIKRHQNAGSALGSSVFIVSAHHGDLDRVRGTLAGCDAYLGKPLQEQELHHLLVRHGMKPPPQPPPPSPLPADLRVG